MTNLLDTAHSMMSDTLIDQAANLCGFDKSKSASIISQFIPAIIGALISKGSTVEGADSLIQIINNTTIQEPASDSFGSSSDPNDFKSLVLNDEIFGSKLQSVLDILSGVSGISKKSGSLLLNLLTPLVSEKLSAEISSNNWNANQLSTFLCDQKSSVSKRIPGLFQVLDSKPDNNKATSTVTMDQPFAPKKSLLKWTLPLVIVLSAVWFLSQDGCHMTEAIIDKQSLPVSDSAQTESLPIDDKEAKNSNYDDQADIIYFSISDQGDLIDKEGNIISIKGEFELKDSFYYDISGQKLGKVQISVKNLQEIPTDSIESKKNESAN